MAKPIVSLVHYILLITNYIQVVRFTINENSGIHAIRTEETLHKNLGATESNNFQTNERKGEKGNKKREEEMEIER